MYLQTKKFDNRLILWGLLILQLFLIITFMIFGTIYINNQDDSTQSLSSSPLPPLEQQQEQNSIVKFIQHSSSSTQSLILSSSSSGSHKSSSQQHHKPTTTTNKYQLKNFTDNFFTLTPLTSENSQPTTVVCYRDGTDIIETTKINACKCLPEWHGNDCSQSEVLWRAFMTSKVPIQLSQPRQIPHKLYYLIDTTGISLETLEIQVMELYDLVDCYILCDIKVSTSTMNNHHYYQRNNVEEGNGVNNDGDRGGVGGGGVKLIDNDEDVKDLKFKIKLQSTGFLKNLTNSNKLILIEDRSCSPKNIYKKFRVNNLNNINLEDIIIYSKSDEILNRKSINYFKWYDNWPQPIRFRLKYTIYGFFWQHPETTIIGSVLCQLKVLENSLYKSDINKLIKYQNNHNNNGIVIGDLNHFGGWLCKYCYQPIDIVKKLQFDYKLNNLIFNYKQIIDSTYIQNLITNGLYIDGKMGLIKLNRYNDKYYSPEYVYNNSWKFDNIVINLFASWDDDYP